MGNKESVEFITTGGSGPGPGTAAGDPTKPVMRTSLSMEPTSGSNDEEEVDVELPPPMPLVSTATSVGQQHNNSLDNNSATPLANLHSQDTNDSSDPSIWWPAIISQAEKLATDSKELASKLEEMWSKECEEADGSSCHQQKDKVIFYRKLRKALDTTLQNMKLLDELVAKLELKYGITANTEEQYNSSSNEAEAQPNATEKIQLPTVEDTLANDESVKFSDTASELSYPDSSSSSFSTSFNSESVLQIDYSDSDSSSSPEIDLNEKNGKRKSSDSDDSLAEFSPSKKRRKRIKKRIKIPQECKGDPKLNADCAVALPLMALTVPSSHSVTIIQALMSDSDSDNSSSNEAEAQPNAAEKIQLPTTSSIPDRNESVLQMLPSDSLLDLDTEETENIPDEAPESAEEKIIIECNSKKSQKGKEGKEETKKTKKRPIQSDSDFQSSESKEEKKKPKTEQVVAGRSVAGIPVDQLQNFSVQQAASFFRCGLS